MKKITTLFLLFGVLCVALVLSVFDELFWQRDKQIIVHTETGKIALYNKSYALVVGNGSYTNGWDPLDRVVRDVKEIATVLEKHGFIVTLETDLKKADFDAAFEAFIRKGAGKDNRLLFYYAGHGHTEINKQTGEESGYLVMVDSPMPMTAGKMDGSRNVSVRSVAGGAKRTEALHALYLFNSSFTDSVLNTRRPQPCTVQDSVKYPVRQFIIAGRANEPAPDASVFKAAFLDLLEGRVAEPIPDGYITGEEFGLYLNHHVPEYKNTQTLQYGRTNDPKFNRGDFVFVFQGGKIPTGNEKGWLKQIVGKDGAKMVPILAGEFKMGSDDRDAHPDERPIHIVYLDAFYIDMHEVTNAQFKKFVDANPEWSKKRKASYHYGYGNYLAHWDGDNYLNGQGNHPVIYVSWYAAMAYAEWAGKRLPTEAEWEKAARGGLTGQRFLQGISQSNRGIGTSVGIYEPNPYGLYGMMDQVWEWCFDAYDYYFYKNSPRENPIVRGNNMQSIDGFINTKRDRVLRGGRRYRGYVRIAHRFERRPKTVDPYTGFRCVMPVIP